MGRGEGGGLDFTAAPPITYDGKWSGWHVEDYDGQPYWEAVFYSDGTLAVSGSVVADAWGIGGGAGNNMTQGGGSGYTAMALDLALSGSVPVTIGQGGAMRAPGTATTLGGLLTCAGGGTPNQYNGGSGGSTQTQPGGTNGGNGANAAGEIAGSGAGYPICRFRAPCKAGDAGAGGTPKSGGGAGGGGWLHWRANDGQNGCGYGGGGTFHQSNVGPGNQGALVIRVKM